MRLKSCDGLTCCENLDNQKYDGKLIGSDLKKNVPVDQYNMNSSEVTAPKGYVIAIVGDSKIDWDNQTVTFTVKEASKATINYYCEAEEKKVGEEVLYVDEGATNGQHQHFQKGAGRL